MIAAATSLSTAPARWSDILFSTSAASPRPTAKRKTLGAIDYVRRLEEVLIRTCADFGIPDKRICGLTGVWTTTEPVIPSAAGQFARELSCGVEGPCDFFGSRSGADSEAKIAAIGVHISRAVTSHGFALNVNTDLDYFNLIIPCGITTKPVTSMAKELGRKLLIARSGPFHLPQFRHGFREPDAMAGESGCAVDTIRGRPVEGPRRTCARFTKKKIYFGHDTSDASGREQKQSLRVSMDQVSRTWRRSKNKQLTAKPTRNATDSNQRTYTIPDYRLEKPEFHIRQVRKGGKVATKSQAT